MLCSIIIRSHNEERHIGRLLDGISRQELPDGVSLEVIVVDSGSTDSTCAIAAMMGATVIHIKKDEFTFGRALNVGCQRAAGDILLFASAHVYPFYKDWVERMIQPFQDARVGLVYGRQIGNEITRFSEHEIFEKWFPGVSVGDQKSPFCNNANCAVRRQIWATQPYNEVITGLEDLEWADRMLKKGFRIVYECEAVIVHVHEETPSKIRNRYEREAIALKSIMPHEHFTKVDFVRLVVSNCFSDFWQALRRNVFLKEFRGIVVFRFMQFLGTYRGHRYSGKITSQLRERFYYPNDLALRRRNLRSTDSSDKTIEYS